MTATARPADSDDSGPVSERQLLINLFDAATAVRASVSIDDLAYPTAGDTFRSWCSAREIAYETRPNQSGLVLEARIPNAFAWITCYLICSSTNSGTAA